MRLSFKDVSTELLEDFVALTDVVLRTRTEPVGGLFIAEGAITIERAFAAGARPQPSCAKRSGSLRSQNSLQTYR